MDGDAEVHTRIGAKASKCSKSQPHECLKLDGPRYELQSVTVWQYLFSSAVRFCMKERWSMKVNP